MNKYEADNGEAADFEESLATEDFTLPTLTNTSGDTKENVNPYIAPDFIIIKNNYAKKNYIAPAHLTFKNTKFTVLPLPFEFDSPVVDPFA